MAESTLYYELLPFARVFLNDTAGTIYTDDQIVTVLRVTTPILKLLGYDKGHRFDPSQIAPELNDTEKVLWAKCAAMLMQNPKALETGLEAVSVRTLGTSYSTEARARFVEAATSKGFAELLQMIRQTVPPFVSSLDNLDQDTLP